MFVIINYKYQLVDVTLFYIGMHPLSNTNSNDSHYCLRFCIGDYEYIEVMVQDQDDEPIRLVVDIDFKS